MNTRWCLLVSAFGLVLGCGSSQTGAGGEPAVESASSTTPEVEQGHGGEEPFSLSRPVDGRELLETPEQTYARQFGSCDFRDPNVRSPFAKHAAKIVATDIAIDFRAPRALRTPAGATLDDLPPELAPLGRALLGAGEMNKCFGAQDRSPHPINSGPGLQFRVAPIAGEGGGVEVSPLDDEEATFTPCIVLQLSRALARVRLDRERVVAVVGIHPDKLAEPMSKQPIEPAAIRKVMNDNMDDVLACYRPALEIWPGLNGTVAVTFAISTADGVVLDARVAGDDTGNPALACCVARKVYGWQFPATGQKGITLVTYPFRLSSE